MGNYHWVPLIPLMYDLIDCFCNIILLYIYIYIMKYFVDFDAKTFLMLKIGGEVKVLFGRGGRWGSDVCV